MISAKEVKTFPQPPQTSSLSSSVSSLTSIPDGEDFVETPHEDIDSDESKTSDNTELVKDKFDQDESGKPINKPANVEANITTEPGIADVEAKKSERKSKIWIQVVRPVGVVIRNIAISAGGLGFDTWAGQIAHSVANGSPSLRCFLKLCCPDTKSRR